MRRGLPDGAGLGQQRRRRLLAGRRDRPSEDAALLLAQGVAHREQALHEAAASALWVWCGATNAMAKGSFGFVGRLDAFPTGEGPQALAQVAAVEASANCCPNHKARRTRPRRVLTSKLERCRVPARTRCHQCEHLIDASNCWPTSAAGPARPKSSKVGRWAQHTCRRAGGRPVGRSTGPSRPPPGFPRPPPGRGSCEWRRPRRPPSPRSTTRPGPGAAASPSRPH